MIFGSTNLTLDNTTYTHTSTTSDLAVNYVYGLVTLVSMLLGLVCNVAVFYYNTIVNTHHVASLIYRCIAVWDLAVCLMRCPQQIYTLFKPDLSPFFLESVSSAQRFFSIFTLSDSLIMGALISLLAVTRFIFLTAPMWSYLHNTAIRRTVLLYILLVHFLTIAVFVKNLTASVFWFGPCQWAIPQGHIFLKFWINFVFYTNLGAGILFSLLTAGWILFKSREERSEAVNQGSVTIILMNSGLVVFLVLWMILDRYLPQSPVRGGLARYVQSQYYVYYVYYLISNLLPMMLAAYNPLIICLRCSDLRRRIRSVRIRWQEKLVVRGGETRNGDQTQTTDILS